MLTIGDLACRDKANEFFVEALGKTLAAHQFRVLFVAPLDSGAACLARVRIEAPTLREVTWILAPGDAQVLLARGQLLPDVLH